MDAMRKSPSSERQALEVTRRGLHAVAETLLAGHQWRQTGSIRLYASPSGFSTGTLESDGSRLCVRGTDLVVADGNGERVIPLQGTLGELAARAEIDFGAPEGVYPSGSSATGSDRVRIDATAAETIAHAYALGDEALRALAATHRPDDPPTPVLWPEHFDIAISLGEVDFGVSAGDDTISEPYAYVGPWKPRRGQFWEQSFGAARRVRDLSAASDLVTFFEEGRAHAQADPSG
jgi:hypothetical protein